MKLKVLASLILLAKVGLLGVLVVTAFLASKVLGFVALGFMVLGMVADFIKTTELIKQDEKAQAEFMQMLAQHTGQGSC